MAKGKKCPECGYTCFVEKEDFQEKGSWITYACQNRNCSSHKRGFAWKERIFESK